MRHQSRIVEQAIGVRCVLRVCQFRFPCSVPMKGKEPAFPPWSKLVKQEEPLGKEEVKRPF